MVRFRGMASVGPDIGKNSGDNFGVAEADVSDSRPWSVAVDLQESTISERANNAMVGPLKFIHEILFIFNLRLWGVGFPYIITRRAYTRTVVSSLLILWVIINEYIKVK